MLELGAQLKTAREAQSLSLEAIAEHTRINIKYLENIEQGVWDFLPEPYIRGIICQFAIIVDLDSRTLLKKYEQQRIEQIKALPAQTGTNAFHRNLKLSLRSALNPFLKNIRQEYLVGGISFIFVLVLFFLFESYNPDTKASQTIDLNTIPLNREIPLDSIQVQPVVAEVLPFRFTIQAIDNTWLKISIDDSLAKEFLFAPGQVIDWEVSNKVNINLGNAGGVTLFIDGRQLDYTGKKGQVVDLELNRSGIIL